MAEPRNGEVVVRAGTTVLLECKANGNPAPTVSWVKLPSPVSEVGFGGSHHTVSTKIVFS